MKKKVKKREESLKKEAEAKAKAEGKRMFPVIIMQKIWRLLRLERKRQARKILLLICIKA